VGLIGDFAVGELCGAGVVDKEDECPITPIVATFLDGEVDDAGVD
jgi:hypothetical protein